MIVSKSTDPATDEVSAAGIQSGQLRAALRGPIRSRRLRRRWMAFALTLQVAHIFGWLRRRRSPPSVPRLRIVPERADHAIEAAMPAICVDVAAHFAIEVLDQPPFVAAARGGRS